MTEELIPQETPTNRIERISPRQEEKLLGKHTRPNREYRTDHFDIGNYKAY